MPALDAVVIATICVAFVGFGLVLAWAEYQTRQVNPNAEKSDRAQPRSRQTVIRQVKERAPSTVSGDRTRATVIN